MIKSFKSFQSLRYPICFGICRRHEIWCIDPASTLFQDFLVFFAWPLFMYYSIPYYHDSKSHQVWTSHLLVTFYIWKTLLETLLALSGKKAREGTASDFFYLGKPPVFRTFLEKCCILEKPWKHLVKNWQNSAKFWQILRNFGTKNSKKFSNF